jgi:hypothetical protein
MEKDRSTGCQRAAAIRTRLPVAGSGSQIASGEDGLAHELLSVQNDRAAAVVLRLLEKNITSRMWYLEQMRDATDELSGRLRTM